MKVLIVGTGIGGLSAYIALHKHLRPLLPSLSLRLVEAYPFLSGHTSSSLISASTIVGAGLGLAPNGFRAIHSFAPTVAQDISLRGFVDGAHRFSMRAAAGHTLGVYIGGSKQRYGGFGMAMVPRGVVFEALLKVVEQIGQKGEGERIEWGRKVVAVTELEAHQGVQVEYQDGTKDVVDLVIGADGVRSRVRDSIFHGKYPAEYNGSTGVGGFIPVALLPPKLKQALLDKDGDDGVVMTFGTKGMFGYSLCTPRDAPNEYVQSGPILQWWCIYQAPEPPYTSARAKTIAEADAVKQELLKLYGTWKSPRDENDSNVNGVFKAIIELGCVSEEVSDTLVHHHTPVLMLPRYVVPRLETYTTPTGRIILLGDAAHAMPPDVGQGVSCAAEDAVVYSLLVSNLLSQEAAQPLYEMSESVLRDAAKGYNELRTERVGKVLDEAKRRGDSKKEMGTLSRWFRDLIMRLVCLLPESLSDFLFAYDGEEAVKYYLAHNA